MTEKEGKFDTPRSKLRKIISNSVTGKNTSPTGRYRQESLDTEVREYAEESFMSLFEDEYAGGVADVVWMINYLRRKGYHTVGQLLSINADKAKREFGFGEKRAEILRIMQEIALNERVNK